MNTKKILIAIFSIAFIVGSSGLSAFGASAKIRTTPRAGSYVEGELIVKYRSQATPAKRSSSLFAHQATALRELGHSGLVHVQLPTWRSVADSLDEYNADQDVEYVQPNYIYKVTNTVPTDPLFAQQWGYNNTGQTIVSPGGPGTVDATDNPGLTGFDMSMEKAWDITTDCTNVVVAVIDSGVNYTNTDLAPNMWVAGGGATKCPDTVAPIHGCDFVLGTHDPKDYNGHGTHVAGTLAAAANNAFGGVGVCWTAKLMSLRVMDATGSGTTATIATAVNYAVTNGAKVINMSLGGSTFDQTFSDAITTAQNAGVVVVVAAGNDGINVDGGQTTYPCNFTQSNVICVAALDQDFHLASFSNYGSTSVDVGAPGVNIVSTWAGATATITDPLTAGWTAVTSGSGWGYETLALTSGATNLIVDPPTFDFATAFYANNSDDHMYKSFNTTGASVAIVTYQAFIDTETNKDYLKTYARAGAGDPIGAGTLLDSQTGHQGTTAGQFSYDISAFINANTTIGFRLTSDGQMKGFGIGIPSFEIAGLAWNNTSVNVEEGTSMATPHVSGLAALVYSYNPSYLYSDVVAAIKQGGVTVTTLTGKTSTSKAANGVGSLSYINTPVVQSAVVQ